MKVEIEPRKEGSGVLFSAPLKSGFLRKQGGFHKSWTRRFFIFCDSTLFYFENEGDVDVKGFFPAENLIAKIDKKSIIVTPTAGSFVRSAKFDKSGQMHIGNHKTLILAAPNESDAREWAELFALSAAK